jgi:hypothetical protein
MSSVKSRLSNENLLSRRHTSAVVDALLDAMQLLPPLPQPSGAMTAAESTGFRTIHGVFSAMQDPPGPFGQSSSAAGHSPAVISERGVSP